MEFDCFIQAVKLNHNLSIYFLPTTGVHVFTLTYVGKLVLLYPRTEININIHVYSQSQLPLSLDIHRSILTL